MSESKEHKRRYNMRLEYIAKFNRWLESEPPMILFWRWRAWKRARPVWEDPREETRGGAGYDL